MSFFSSIKRITPKSRVLYFVLMNSVLFNLFMWLDLLLAKDRKQTFQLTVLQVVWTDQWSTILTFQEKTIIDDERIHVDHTFAREWNLRVNRVKYGDQGIYTCQVNTEPVISYTVHLTVVGETAFCALL